MKTKLFILLFPLLSFGQIQTGSDIIKGLNSSTTALLSNDGTVLAVASSNSNVNGSNSGQVQVYKKTGDIWKQIGDSFKGEGADDRLGNSISLNSDGSILAIGASKSNYTGQVRVYKNTMNVWTQIGDSFNGEKPNDRLGNSISLNRDGNILAIGSPLKSNRVYKNNAGVWKQIGNDISNSAYSNISLSGDGNILAVGNPSESDLNFSGAIRVYGNTVWTWLQVGNTIHGKKLNYGENIGSKILLSRDGSTLAALSGYGTGIARIYRNVSGTWTQLGADIQHYNNADYIDASLSDDGTILVFKAPSSKTESSRVIIYKYTAGSWTQIGKTIYAENIDTVSLSGDGLTLAITIGYISNTTPLKKIDIYDLSSLSNLKTDRFETITTMLYPNPASHVVTLDLNENTQLKEVNIYDTLGKLVKTINKNVVDVSLLSSGTYFFEIITDKGKTTKTVLKK